MFIFVAMELRIKEVAKLKGYTLRKIAKEIGIHHQVLTNYISGNRIPNIKKLQKIAHVLNCSIHQLIKAPDGFIHIEDNKGEWTGIKKI